MDDVLEQSEDRRQKWICCMCQEKKRAGEFASKHQGYDLFGGGTAIRLYCRKCKEAFLGLPRGHQSFYIRSRCDEPFPAGQMIYSLIDPESHLVRYIGRTHDLKKRFQRHLSERSNEPAVLNGIQYYSRSNWMYDLFSKGLRPSPPDVVNEVRIAPAVIEWETRYILHGFQQDWPLVNIESAVDDFVARAKASTLDFLDVPFDALLREGFFREDGIEAFVHAHYR